MKMILDRLPPGLRVGTPVLISAAAVGISAVVLAVGVGSVTSTALLPSVGESEADPVTTLATKSAEEIERSRKRFDNRSMYTLPPAPPRRTAVVKREDPKPPPVVDLGPPPVPSSYTGPQPSSVLGDSVIFGSLTDENKSIKVGETKAGITVLAINAPYAVKLGYQRGEFTVSLLAKPDPAMLKSGGSSSRGSIPGFGNPAAGASTDASGGKSVGAAGAAAGLPRGTGTGGGATGGAPSANAESLRSGGTTAGGVNKPLGDAPQGGTTGGASPTIDANNSALQPQRFPTPPQDPETPTQEFVDRELLPPRLTEAQINGFSVDQARAALEAINSTEAWNVDDHSRARLNHEKGLLKARLSRN